MVEGILNQVLAWVTATLGPLFYISPFWYWVWWGFVATALAVIVGWGFPALRSFSATVILVVIAGLSGYRRGQYDQYHHDRGEER